MIRTAGSLAGLSRGQHAKPTTIGIGHDHPADLLLADVDTSQTRRATSSCWSPWAGRAMWKCSLLFPDFGIIASPSQESQEIFGSPCGERIAV
jgi:hypothetical protein